MKHFSVLLVLLSVTGVSVAATIHVPANQPTIQAGINAAKNGDRVVVARGTYFENINFAGKAITVVASGGRTVTIIDGGHAGRVVTFDSGEGRESVLEGFTVQNGNASLEGGGIYIFNASPTIKLNTVTNNVACGSGAGIAVEFSSALVQNNVISSNSESGSRAAWAADFTLAERDLPSSPATRSRRTLQHSAAVWPYSPLLRPP